MSAASQNFKFDMLMRRLSCVEIITGATLSHKGTRCTSANKTAVIQEFTQCIIISLTETITGNITRMYNLKRAINTITV